MRALWLTAVAVSALASVATAAQAQESSHSRQAPAGATQPAPPEALQPRPVQTQSFRRDAEPDTPQPVQTQAVRKRNRSVTTGQATRQATRQVSRQVSRQATRQVSRRATARASSVRRTSRPLPLYAQARSAERAAAVREVIVSPAGPPRTGLSAGFNEYITRMNIWSRPPWEIPATVGATVPLGIQVYGMPAEIVAIDPAFAGDPFVVVGDDVVILEPDSRRIVAMLSRTSGAYVAERMAAPATTVSTTGLAPPEDRVRLSRGQVAVIRTVLRHRECRDHRRSDFFVGSLVPRTTPLCDFPERVIAAVPDIEGYRYVTRRNAVLVVDPDSDRVVSVVR